MSRPASDWAWKQGEERGLRAPATLVLLCLADCHNFDTGRCDPSIQFIHKRTRLNKKTIPAAISEIEKCGLITVKKRVGISASYTLNMDESFTSFDAGLPEKGTPKNGGGGTPKNGQGDPPKPGEPLPQKRVTNQELTIKEPNIKEPKIKKELDFSVWPELPSDQTMNDWQAMRKRQNAHVSQTVINTFAKELEKAVQAGISVDQCLSECVTRNWRGFEFKWICNRGEKDNAASRRINHTNSLRSIEQQAFDEYAKAEAEEAGISSLESNDPAIWPSVGQPGR